MKLTICLENNVTSFNYNIATHGLLIFCTKVVQDILSKVLYIVSVDSILLLTWHKMTRHSDENATIPDALHSRKKWGLSKNCRNLNHLMAAF